MAKIGIADLNTKTVFFVTEATATGDFTNIATNNAADGVYTLNGSPVMIGDIVDLDDEFALFDPETDIDAGGMKVRHDGEVTQGLTVSVQPSVVAGIGAQGMAAVFTLEMSDSFAVNFYAYSPGLDEVNGVTVGRGLSNGFINGVNITGFDGEDVNLTTSEWVPPAGPCKVAIAFATDHISVSINGAAIYRFDHVGWADDCNYAQFIIGGTMPDVVDGRLGTFAFYDLVDDADLPALSAP